MSGEALTVASDVLDEDLHSGDDLGRCRAREWC